MPGYANTLARPVAMGHETSNCGGEDGCVHKHCLQPPHACYGQHISMHTPTYQQGTRGWGFLSSRHTSTTAMDPLTAIGLVGNILAFIDFSTKLLKTAKQVYDSSHGTLEENKSREVVVREMEQLSAGLLTPKATVLSEGDANLETLARECHEISIQLISLLNKIKPKDPDSVGQSVISALKNKHYAKDREGLEMRLENCRSQLDLQLNFLARSAATHAYGPTGLLLNLLTFVQKRDAGEA